MKNAPKISVIMPVYNAEKYLDEAVESILNQTYSDFELIIINDCSNDNSEKIILSYDDSRIKYIKNETNLGVALSLNRGLDEACGEYIARMDADDISLPLRFEKQLEFMEKNANVAVCGCEAELFGDVINNDTFTVFGKEDMKINMLFSSCICHPAVMIRRSVFEKEHFRYDVNFDKLEDYELWTRVFVKYDLDNVHGVYFRYRIHQNQVTQNYSIQHKNKLLQIKHNIIDNLGIKFSKEEFFAYFNFCIGEFNYEDFFFLASSFEKIIKQNDRTMFFDKEKLSDYLSGIILKLYCNQKNVKFDEIKRVFDAIDKKQVVHYNMKKLIKNVLGR